METSTTMDFDIFFSLLGWLPLYYSCDDCGAGFSNIPTGIQIRCHYCETNLLTTGPKICIPHLPINGLPCMNSECLAQYIMDLPMDAHLNFGLYCALQTNLH